MEGEPQDERVRERDDTEGLRRRERLDKERAIERADRVDKA